MYHTTEGWQWSQGHLGMLLTLFDKENLFIKVSYEQELSHHASTIPLLDGGKNKKTVIPIVLKQLKKKFQI